MAHRSISDLFSTVVADLSAVVSDTAALAKAEFSKDAKRLGVAIGALVAAGFVVLMALLLLVLTVAQVLIAVGLPPWAAYLIDAGIWLVLAVVLVFWGLRLFKGVTGPKQTMAAVRDSMTALAGKTPAEAAAAAGAEPTSSVFGTEPSPSAGGTEPSPSAARPADRDLTDPRADEDFDF